MEEATLDVIESGKQITELSGLKVNKNQNGFDFIRSVEGLSGTFDTDSNELHYCFDTFQSGLSTFFLLPLTILFFVGAASTLIFGGPVAFACVLMGLGILPAIGLAYKNSIKITASEIQIHSGIYPLLKKKLFAFDQPLYLVMAQRRTNNQEHNIIYLEHTNDAPYIKLFEIMNDEKGQARTQLLLSMISHVSGAFVTTNFDVSRTPHRELYLLFTTSLLILTFFIFVFSLAN